MEKINNMQEQTDNVSREMDILRKKKKMIEIKKNNVSKMRKACDGLISKLDKAEERISELQDITTEISETEKQREKKKTWKKPPNIQELWDNHKKCNIYVQEERNRSSKIENCPKLMLDTK